MLYYCERDGPIRGCFAASMAVVLVDALPPWFWRLLGRRGRRFCGYTILLPVIVLAHVILDSVGWGCEVEVPLIFSLFVCICRIRW
jgi:hypothetical protein